jgi:hypothetical protein
MKTMKLLTASYSLYISACVGTIAGLDAEPGRTPPPATTARNSIGPRIVFDAAVYDFGKLSAGDVANHTFVFTNAGDGLLELTAVQASCGCTTAGEWSRKVEPGKTGTIPIQFNSANFNGAVAKTVTVTCNDSNQPTLTLQLKGTVWRLIDVTPAFAVLNVRAESLSNATDTVRIVNNMELPVTLSDPECNNKAFSAQLRTKVPGKEFELIISTISPLEANVNAGISIKTSATNFPVINVIAFANVTPAVVVTPSQISLPPAPLPTKLARAISIQNNGTNLLGLSEPAVNTKGVEIQVKELQAGQRYDVVLTFPEGFKIAEGEKLGFSIKSSHPQFRTIKVPVLQEPTLGTLAPASAPTVPHKHPVQGSGAP